MKVKVVDRYRKVFHDILRIFSNEDLIIANDANLIITDDRAILDREYSFKNGLELKRLLYDYFSELYAYKSPWGLMTGTKPSKLYKLKGEDILRKDYLISEEKLSILREISLNHKGLRFDKSRVHLYINIPFCPSRCSYCSFPTIVYHKNDRRDEFLSHLLLEIKTIAPYINKRKLRTIYIGGGTPSALTYKQLEEFFSCIKSELDLSSLVEFTFEAGREDTLDFEKLKLIKQAGVTRISINPQSFNEKTMNSIGRNQDMARLIEIYHQAKNLGFIINMDLIVGLSGEGLNDVKLTLEKIAQLRPHNLTIHTLSLKKGAKLYEMGTDLKTERILISDILDYCQLFTRTHGYSPYYLYRQKAILGNFENIGYCLDGEICHYNIATNEEVESIVGLGMTSNSKIYVGSKMAKYTNYKNLDEYIEKLPEEIENKINLLN